MASYAILIDGGFAKRKLGTAEKPATAEDLKAFTDRLATHPRLVGKSLHRIYYYDAQPFTESRVVPLSGGEKINYGATEVAVRNTKLLQAVCRNPYYASRLGETVFRGWALKQEKLQKAKGATVEVSKDDLSPVIAQKGVDMRIGLDIASLTLKRIVQIIVLVTGDSDFVPAMKFARREGAQLFLVTFDHSIRDAVEEHADVMLRIDECAPAAVPTTEEAAEKKKSVLRGS